MQSIHGAKKDKRSLIVASQKFRWARSSERTIAVNEIMLSWMTQELLIKQFPFMYLPLSLHSVPQVCLFPSVAFDIYLDSLVLWMFHFFPGKYTHYRKNLSLQTAFNPNNCFVPIEDNCHPPSQSPVCIFCCRRRNCRLAATLHEYPLIFLAFPNYLGLNCGMNFKDHVCDVNCA